MTEIPTCECGKTATGLNSRRTPVCMGCALAQGIGYDTTPILELMVARDIESIASIYPTAFNLYDEPLNRLSARIVRTLCGPK